MKSRGVDRSLIGQKIDELLVLERVEDYISPKGQHKTQYLCLCNCGNTIKKTNCLLKSNSLVKSCGCVRPNRNGVVVNKGDTFGKLTILSEKYLKAGRWTHLVACQCGKNIEVRQDSLTGGNTKSCGCLIGETSSRVHTTHGRSTSKAYQMYHGILARCNNPNQENYVDYGGRGITVCDRWLEPDGKGFLNFVEDMGERPEGMSLDRIDVNGHYCKKNCRWASASTQMFNRRCTSTTGRTGVFWNKRRQHYFVSITKDHKSFYGGSSKSFEVAVKLAENLEIELRGEIRSDPSK